MRLRFNDILKKNVTILACIGMSIIIGASVYGESKATAIKTVLEVKEIGGIEFVKIPAGSFMMGSLDGEGENDEHPRHKVTLSGFWIGKYVVIQKQYRNVMGSNPSYFKGDDLYRSNISQVTFGVRGSY